MLKKWFLIGWCCFSFGQSEQLALDYFERGEYEKALPLLEAVSGKLPSNSFYFEKITECYRHLQQYDKALALIAERRKKYRQPQLIVEEGYMYQLKKDQPTADQKYQEAVNEVFSNPNYAYSIGSSFEKKSLLGWAMQTYETAQKQNPNLNFDYQVALLNGQMGNLDVMIEKMLDYAYIKPDNTPLVQNYLSRFLMENASDTFLGNLKKSLIARTQKNTDIYWNEFLSWFYVQQKDFGKAFVQEKAVYRRNPDSFENIIALASMALEDEQLDTAGTILQFVLENAQDTELQIEAHYFLMKIKTDQASEADYPALKTEFENLLQQYGISPLTLDLQLLSAHFECFYLGNSKKAITLLNQTLDLPLNIRQTAEVKMELADILLYDEKFNQAILYYAQVEDNLKNTDTAHEASMKMAKANYYKTDFDWALQQVSVLKQSSSFLIANDAIEMFLLINDNSQDSTRTALTAFSKANFKLYQNKKEEALQGFLDILTQFKGDDIEDETLLKTGKIYQQKKQYHEALHYFDEILKNHSDSIFTDEALFFSAEIYRRYLDDTEKAKPLYEKIIFDHQDSIYFTEAQRQYRILRGDTNI